MKKPIWDLRSRCAQRHDISRSQRGHHMEFLTSLAEDGKLRPVIDRVYGLEQVQKARAYSESGHAHGKAVLIVGRP